MSRKEACYRVISADGIDYETIDAEISKANETLVRCPVCGNNDNNWPARHGLCLDCYCMAIYMQDADGISDKIRQIDAKFANEEERTKLLKQMFERLLKRGRRVQSIYHSRRILARRAKMLEYLKANEGKHISFWNLTALFDFHFSLYTIEHDFDCLRKDGKIRVEYPENSRKGKRLVYVMEAKND